MSTDSFKVFWVDERDSALVIAPQGDVISFRGTDVHSELKSLEAMIDRQPGQDVVFDLGSVNYFGSIMIGMIISLAKRVNEQRGRVALAATSPDMLRMLRAMHLDSMWAHFDNVKAALKALKEASRKV